MSQHQGLPSVFTDTGEFDIPEALYTQDDVPLQAFQLPAKTKQHPPETTNPWDPRLIMDLALSIETLEDILPRYGLTTKEYNILSRKPAFKRELGMAIRDVNENGLTFKKKAMIQAESYLEVLDELVYDATTPSNVRLESIKSAVTWAGLLPKEEKQDTTNATQVNVNISF